jgi:hypothetical protein
VRKSSIQNPAQRDGEPSAIFNLALVNVLFQVICLKTPAGPVSDPLAGVI